MENKRPPEETRTFESRLKFINEIFTNRFERYQIMASCIKYKLNKSYQQYLKEIDRSLDNLAGRDPIAILRKIED